MVKADIEAIHNGLMEVLVNECEEIIDWLWAQVQSKVPPHVNRNIIRNEVLVMANKVYGYVCMGDNEALGLRGDEAINWMEGIIALCRPYIFERLVRTVQDFPFHKFISDEGR